MDFTPMLTGTQSEEEGSFERQMLKRSLYERGKRILSQLMYNVSFVCSRHLYVYMQVDRDMPPQSYACYCEYALKCGCLPL